MGSTVMIHLQKLIIPHAVAMLDLIANPSNISEGRLPTPVTISLVSGSSRPDANVVITFNVSGTATGNFLKLHVYVNTLKIVIFSVLVISAGADFEAPGDFTYTTFRNDDQSFNLRILEDDIAELPETITLQASVLSGSAQFSIDTVTITLKDDDGTYVLRLILACR